jgi:hypothetical protein
VRDDKNALIGVNKAVADNLSIFLEENEVHSITFRSKPEATLFPEKDLSASDVKLKDFKWEENARPASKEDVLKEVEKKVEVIEKK